MDQLTTQILNNIAKEIKKPENQETLNEIVKPLIKNISNKMYHWINILFFMYSLILILIVSILILILINKKST
jgi:hypothetical protein